MKNIKLKSKVLLTLISLILGSGWICLNGLNNVYADTDKPETALSVSPMQQKIILIPGESYEGTINVINGGAAKNNLKYVVEIAPYSVKNDPNSGTSDDYGVFDVIDSTNYNIITNWVTLNKTTGEIQPNDKDVITYKIEVPKDAPAGAQYMAILVHSEGSSSDNKSGSSKGVGATIKSNTQIASTVFANVAGETIEKGSIKSNDMPTMLTNNKLEATSMVRNDGNIYTNSTYTLQVWPMGSDEEICTNEEQPDSSTILPDTERYHVQSCNLPAVGIFKAKQVVKIFSEESVLEKTIFVCPIWLMVLVLIVVVGIVVGIIIYIKKRHSAKED